MKPFWPLGTFLLELDIILGAVVYSHFNNVALETFLIYLKKECVVRFFAYFYGLYT